MRLLELWQKIGDRHARKHSEVRRMRLIVGGSFGRASIPLECMVDDNVQISNLVTAGNLIPSGNTILFYYFKCLLCNGAQVMVTSAASVTTSTPSRLQTGMLVSTISHDLVVRGVSVHSSGSLSPLHLQF